jgi:Cu/Ag efflux pump CusA
VQTYLQQVIGRSQANTSDALTLRVLGEDHKVLREQADKLQQVLAGINGVVDQRAVLPPEEPTVEIEVDLDSAQRYGVKPGDVRRAAATLLSGINVGSLFEEQKVFDVVVWSTPETRDSIEDISSY